MGTDDMLDALDAWMAEGMDMPEPDGDDPPEPLHLEDRAAANRMLRTLGRLDREEADVWGMVDAEIARLRDFAEDRTAGIDRKRAWLYRSLEGFMRGLDVKTLRLPDGELTLRPGRQRIELDETAGENFDALRGFDPDFVRDEPRPVKTLIGQKVEPGVEVLYRTDDGAHEAHPGVVKRPDERTGELIEHRVPGVVVLVPVGTKFAAKATSTEVPDGES